jgi:hypothetical protein
VIPNIGFGGRSTADPAKPCSFSDAACSSCPCFSAHGGCPAYILCYCGRYR